MIIYIDGNEMSIASEVPDIQDAELYSSVFGLVQ
jgi:hypothetical protein